MPSHPVLMLAATGIVFAFVGTVVLANWLQCHRRGPGAGRYVDFRGWGRFVVAAASTGAAVIHLAVVRGARC